MDNIFTTKLTKLFESVEPLFRSETISRYRQHAKMTHKAWLERMAKPEGARFAYESSRIPEYTKHSKGSWSSVWENLVRDIAAGLFVIDYAKAERDANRAVSGAKENFISKQSDKLNTATKLCKGKPELRGELRCDGVVTGHLMVLYSDKNHFVLNMSMIVNYRHGHGYYQFPARFTEVFIGGEKQTGSRISEDWMSRNFKG